MRAYALDGKQAVLLTFADWLLIYGMDSAMSQMMKAAIFWYRVIMSRITSFAAPTQNISLKQFDCAIRSIAMSLNMRAVSRAKKYGGDLCQSIN